MNNIFDGGNITRVKLDNPKRTKRTKQNFSCDFCDEDHCWDSETEVYIHKMRSHNLKIRKKCGKVMCRVCLRMYSSSKEMNNHIKTTHLHSSDVALRVEQNIFVCDLCDEIFFNKELLAIHIAKRHKIAARNVQYCCPRCNKKMRLHQVLLHFNTYHEAQSLWRCQTCLSKTDSPEGLKKHMQNHPKHLFCDICQSKMRSSNAFAEHSLKHAVDSKDIALDMSMERVASYFIPKTNDCGVRRNAISVFRGLAVCGIKICVLCREMCNSSGMLQHLKCHMPQRGEEKCLFVCHCGLQFNNKILLKQHQFKVKCDTIKDEQEDEEITEENIIIVVDIVG